MFGHWQDSHNIYILMPYAAGGELLHLIREQEQNCLGEGACICVWTMTVLFSRERERERERGYRDKVKLYYVSKKDKKINEAKWLAGKVPKKIES